MLSFLQIKERGGRDRKRERDESSMVWPHSMTSNSWRQEHNTGKGATKLGGGNFEREQLSNLVLVSLLMWICDRKKSSDNADFKLLANSQILLPPMP